jgi:hypothetical protein
MPVYNPQQALVGRFIDGNHLAIGALECTESQIGVMRVLNDSFIDVGLFAKDRRV